MKIYIPKKGDEIVLEKACEFKLYAYNRKSNVSKISNHYIYIDNAYYWIDGNKLENMRNPDYKIVYPDPNNYTIDKTKSRFITGNFDGFTYNLARQAAVNSNEQYQKYISDLNDFKEKAKNFRKQYITVELPAKTVLKIDVVNILKNNIDNSTIKFKIGNLDKVKVEGKLYEGKFKNLVFYFNISDMYDIEFEKI